MLRSVLLTFGVLTNMLSGAQDLSGFWRGKLTMGSGGCFPVYQIELQLRMEGNQIVGRSYHFSDSSNFISDDITGSWDPAQQVAIIRETGIVRFRIKEDCVPCLKNYELRFLSNNRSRSKESQLRGDWYTPSGRAIDGRTPCTPGSIILTRSDQSAFPDPDLSKKKPTKKIDQLIQEIRLDSTEVQLALYDNGQIDGDTVSVFVNQKPVIEHKMLRSQPIELRIKVDPENPLKEVVMVGENLGQIPPNTALMIITTKTDRFQLYLTADGEKNAMIRFIYDPAATRKN
jgi:hypothetical protein